MEKSLLIWITYTLYLKSIVEITHILYEKAFTFKSMYVKMKKDDGPYSIIFLAKKQYFYEKPLIVYSLENINYYIIIGKSPSIFHI